MDQELANYIKYCLGYIKLTRERTALAQQKLSINLPSDYFDLIGLLNGDTDGEIAELVDLKTFYKYDPDDVPEEELERYESEKEFANKIDSIYSKYRNDQFTKQVLLSFGYFEIELPIENGATIEPGEEDEEAEKPELPKTKIDRYPLFSIPVRIDKEIEKGVGKYYIYSLDPEVQVNIGILQSILGDDLYFQLLEEMGKYEIDGRLVLPITSDDVFIEIWHKIKAQLRLKEAKFSEKSFALEDIRIALSPRANYFLAEDLARMAQLSEEDLEKTSLTSWISDDGLNIKEATPKERELYFPFLYDKYQLATLSVLGNKAAIIQGPPGTGKSETISNILCHLAATGKRVLFVSQKAQALKVVKDKLKKLDVKYLYGYLPNPNSAQVGEEDEADGIAPQLSGLGSYIDRMHSADKVVPPLEQVVDQRETSREALNAAVDAQRKFYKLHQELLSLKDYDLEISDMECFSKSFSSAEWRDIKGLKAELETLEKTIRKYGRSSEKKEFDKQFSALDFSNPDIAEAIGRIKEDVAKTGYDRRSKLFRNLNNLTRNMRVGTSRDKLPREIIDYIDKALASDTSRREQAQSLESLYAYCFYYGNIQRLEVAEEKLAERLNTCGVSDGQFAVIDGKIEGATSEGLDEVKTKILRVQELKKELDGLTKSASTNRITSSLQKLEDERTKRIAGYIQNIIDTNLAAKWGRGVSIRQVIQRLAKAFGKSKKAFKTFDSIRKDPDNFNAILDLIPIWIMELDDASRIIPLEPGVFDYVILDEASQCNVAYTLPVMYRANRAIFVGDSEQMRDSTIMFKSNRTFDEMARKYQIPDDRQIKATGSSVQSVLDIAKNRGFLYRTLHYHYRSPAELIGFSNDYFYKPNGKDLIPLNSNYLTYKDTNRVMLVHEVQSDWSEEISDHVNVAEAKEILALFKELRDDERYRDKSIGILSFFNAQATFIRDLFEKEGYKEEDDNYKVSIIEGVQGDEKDIIIYSFVIRKPEQRNKYFPLTGEGGDIKGDINKGRVNVAFSRARFQVHCFVSLPPKDMPDRIWLKKYLEYAEKNGEVSFYSTDLKPFDSHFEEEFYGLLKSSLKRGYKIQNQVGSCGFKIDFVVSNTVTGKRIAVECDGPCHFKDEIDEAYGIHVANDEERQRVLEAAGWRFCRVKYADWISEDFDRKVFVDTIVDLLK